MWPILSKLDTSVQDRKYKDPAENTYGDDFDFEILAKL